MKRGRSRTTSLKRFDVVAGTASAQKPARRPGRDFEEVREKDPDGAIVVHHRTVGTLGKMVRAGTITPAMPSLVMTTRCGPPSAPMTRIMPRLRRASITWASAPPLSLRLSGRGKTERSARLFDAPEEKSLRTLRYELDLTESTIAKLQGRIDELRKSPTLGFTTFIDTAQISALQSKIDELSRVRGQTQARIAFLEGPPEQSHAPGQTPPAPDDTAGVKDRSERLQRIQEGLESTLFGITHEGSERIIAEHERRVAEIEVLRAKDGSNAEQVDRLVEQSATVREAQLSQLSAKEAEAADKVRAANDRVVEGLNAERAALTSTGRERFVAQAMSRLSAEATAAQRREVEELAGALYDEQQALQARQRLMDEGRSVTDRTRSATEQYAAEVEKLDDLLAKLSPHRLPDSCRALSPAAGSACSTRAGSWVSAHRVSATRTLASSSMRSATTVAALRARASCPTRCRSSLGAASW